MRDLERGEISSPSDPVGPGWSDVEAELVPSFHLNAASRCSRLDKKSAIFCRGLLFKELTGVEKNSVKTLDGTRGGGDYSQLVI